MISATPTTTRGVGVMLPRDLPVDEVRAFARRADALGFDQLWVVEDLGFRGGVAQAAVVLADTERIRVGIGILPTGARNAAFTAMELATLSQLFPGRVIAGIGHGMPGWMRQVGAWPRSPLTLLDEYTTAVGMLLRGAPGPAAGRYVDVQGVVLSELPTTVPPILLGVRGPKSLALAGRRAQGVVLAEPATPTYIAASIAHVRGGRDEDADLEPLTVVTYDIAAVSHDAATAIELARPGLAWIGEPDWAVHLTGLPFAEDLADHRGRCASPAEFAATMPAEWVSALALAGSTEDVRRGIAARHEAGATCIVLTPVGDGRLSALDALSGVL